MVTEKFLVGIINGSIWCPLFKEIKLSPCPKPPSKEFLINRLKSYVKKEKKIFDINEKHLPDKTWVLNVLSSFTPNDEIFHKNYVPPAKIKKIFEIKSVNLPSKFI